MKIGAESQVVRIGSGRLFLEYSIFRTQVRHYLAEPYEAGSA